MIEDRDIVELYWARNERAIEYTATRYGAYCYAIAHHILHNAEDAEECVNDTYLDAWNSMPPHRPRVLSAFLGKITRRISIDRWRESHAKRRGGGELLLALDELGECVASSEDIPHEVQTAQLAARIEVFLGTLSDDDRRMFIRRYWHVESIAELAAHFGCSETRVKASLHRTRGKLRTFLEKEGLL